jgi:hypothetical protein
MAEVAPIRPLDDDAALAWLRAQPEGRTNLPAAELARRWGWHRQRAGRRIKTWMKEGLVRRRGRTVIAADGTRQKATRQRGTNDSQRLDHAPEIHGSVTPSIAPSKTSAVSPLKAAPATSIVTGAVTATAGIDVTAYLAAITLAGAAAFFSVKGMAVLFPGAPLAVVGMAIAMEGAKLVTAGWLARRWRATAWVWRLILVVLVAGLAVINATGVYAQLVSAHVGERGAAQSAIETQDAALAARIDVQAHTVADLDRRLGQIDSAIEEAAKRGRTTTALTAIEGQRKARAEIAGQRQREATALADLKAERAALAAKGRQIETEAAPIRYVAELIGADTDSEQAIRWLIALMVLCCDPLAIALTAAASARR